MQLSEIINKATNRLNRLKNTIIAYSKPPTNANKSLLASFISTLAVILNSIALIIPFHWPCHTFILILYPNTTSCNASLKSLLDFLSRLMKTDLEILFQVSKLQKSFQSLFISQIFILIGYLICHIIIYIICLTWNIMTNSISY